MMTSKRSNIRMFISPRLYLGRDQISATNDGHGGPHDLPRGGGEDGPEISALRGKKHGT